jgi:hypothetical protein
MNIRQDTDGVDYVSVDELLKWIEHVTATIEAECSGAPEGCNETRAYLYGEICSFRVLRKTVAQWKSPVPPQPADAVAKG